MKTRTKFAILDTVFNYVLFTPLVLLFWYGTYALIDAVILSQFESRLVGATVTLVLGFYVEFTITYWQVPDTLVSIHHHHHHYGNKLSNITNKASATLS